MSSAITHLVIAPADGVNDLSEWYGRLDAELALSGDARWRCERDALVADLPAVEAARVAERARDALGDAVDVSVDSGATVVATDAAAWRAIDE